MSRLSGGQKALDAAMVAMIVLNIVLGALAGWPLVLVSAAAAVFVLGCLAVTVKLQLHTQALRRETAAIRARTDALLERLQA